MTYKVLQMFTETINLLLEDKYYLEFMKLNSKTSPIPSPPPSTAFMRNVLILPVTTLTKQIQNYLFSSFYRNKNISAVTWTEGVKTKKEFYPCFFLMSSISIFIICDMTEF